ncbi:MAG TPA: Fic family protein [Chthoniobacterales bacterium]
MLRGLTGHYTLVSNVGETCKAFIPNPLPPDPPLEVDAFLHDLLNNAALALGRLDGITAFLPQPQLFLYTYIRKEAVLSSQIEGTQSSLSDLVIFEAQGIPGAPLGEVQEVSNYAAALQRGLELLGSGLPLSLRLIREIHGVLLSKGRGAHQEPGEFRRSQNWVGGTRPGNASYVPPPPDQALECLGQLEKFLHNEPVRTPWLIKAALAHVQFETIHPFLDGNGRVGRLLITFLFCAEGVLREPLLYLSLYFKQHRERYYELLQQVRLTGNWEEWLLFFLTGVVETADQAVRSAHRLLAVFRSDHERVAALGKSAGSALRLHEYLQRHPITSTAGAAESTGLSAMTCGTILKKLEAIQLVREITGGQYGRLYAYNQYLKILNEGTEPLA